MRISKFFAAAAGLGFVALLAGLIVLTSPAAGAASPTTTNAVAYQGDALHDGQVAGGTLTPGLQEVWSDSGPGDADFSYPLIAGGLVYFTVANPLIGYGTALYAVNESTGTVAWGPVELGGTYYISGIAYDAGEIFALNYDGQLSEYNAATGAAGWSIQLPNQWSFTSAPTAANGAVYVGGAGIGGTIYAVDESTGALLWTASVENGDDSSPLVTDTGVYVSYACGQTYDFDPANGALIWYDDSYCEGGGGTTLAYNDGLLYLRDEITGDRVLNASNGAIVRTFASQTIPAFFGTTAFTMIDSTLSALSSTGTVLWTFAGDGGLDTAPLVVNGYVYVGSSSGNLYALDASDGAVVWSANVGQPLPAPDEQNAVSLSGMASDGNTLVVAGSRSELAFVAGPATTPPATTPSLTTTPTSIAPTSSTSPTASGTTATVSSSAAVTPPSPSSAPQATPSTGSDARPAARPAASSSATSRGATTGVTLTIRSRPASVAPDQKATYRLALKPKRAGGRVDGWVTVSAVIPVARHAKSRTMTKSLGRFAAKSDAVVVHVPTSRLSAGAHELRFSYSGGGQVVMASLTVRKSVTR